MGLAAEAEAVAALPADFADAARCDADEPDEEVVALHDRPTRSHSKSTAMSAMSRALSQGKRRRRRRLR